MAGFGRVVVWILGVLAFGVALALALHRGPAVVGHIVDRRKRADAVCQTDLATDFGPDFSRCVDRVMSQSVFQIEDSALIYFILCLLVALTGLLLLAITSRLLPRTRTSAGSNEPQSSSH